MSPQEKSVSSFLRRVVRVADPATEVDVVLLGARGAQSVLTTIKVGDARGWTDEELDSRVSNVLETCQEDADGLGGVNRYFLRASFAQGRTSRSSVFRVAARDDADGELAGSEPATVEGLMAQLMRHNEALTRSVVQLSSSTSGSQAEIIARMSETAMRHERERVRQIELTEELLSRKHERSIELAREERKSKNAERLMSGVAPFVPIVGAKLLTGGKIPAVAGKAAIGEFLRGIKPAQMMKIFEVLDAPQAAALLELTKHIELDDDKKEDDRGREGNESDDRAGAGFH